MKRGIIDVPALQISDECREVNCQVIEEDTLVLDVEGIGHFALMWTPTAHSDQAQGFTVEDGLLGDVDNPEKLALAMGFARSEGLISSTGDIRSLAICPDNPGVVRLQLNDPEKAHVSRRNVVVNSSCGICGATEILEGNVPGLDSVATDLALNYSDFMSLMAEMKNAQHIFQQTGGAHAAAVFDHAGAIITMAEDLGRHNALDKAIGQVLLQDVDSRNCGVVLSSRLSLEMVVKAVRAGMQIMLAVSAPTSLAIAVAERYGITLCGFVREGRATIYTHPHRIRNLPSSGQIELTA